MMRIFPACAAVLVLATGCREKSRESDKGVHSAAPSSETSPRVTSVPTVSADASSISTAIAPPEPAKVVASALTVQPQLLGQNRCPLVLHNPRGAVVVAECADISVLRDGKLEAAKLPTTGFGVEHFSGEPAEVSEVHRITGRWPDALVVELTRLDAMQSDRGTYFSPQDSTYELVGGRWREVLEAPTPQAAAWSQGRTIIFRKNQFELMAGRKDAPLPERAPSQRDCGASNVSDFAAMVDGTVVTVGMTCDKPKRFRAEIIEEGKPGVDFELKSSTVALEKATPRIVGDNREALFVVAPAVRGAILWKFQKSGFVELAVPSKLPLVDAHVTANGQLWLALDGPTKEKGKATPSQLYRRMPTGIWESIRLPSNEVLHSQVKSAKEEQELRFVPGSIASFADGQVWLAGSVVQGVDASLATLLARAGGEAAVTAPEVGSRSGPESPEPYRSGCESPFVLLYSVGAAVPADYSFPATRDALRGSEFLTSARFVEFKYKEKRTLGALVPTAEAGKLLVSRLQLAVRGSKPQLMCFAPKAVDREVELK